MTPPELPLPFELVLEEVNGRLCSRFRLQQQLSGGEQNGAYLVVDGELVAVMKWQPVQWKATQLLRAFPAVRYAADHGWPVARWLDARRLAAGGAYLLQEYVVGTPLSSFGPDDVTAVVVANRRQTGLAFPDAADDSAQLEEVLSGEDEWKSNVANFTQAGAELVRHGDEIVARAGAVPIPKLDVVHGDYSSSNILIDNAGSARFVDSETVSRGTRVRDLADLYRQSFYPGVWVTGLSLLRAEASDVEGPQVFAKCAVAVTYNNLAWWVEQKTATEFDHACARLHRLFDDVHQDPS